MPVSNLMRYGCIKSLVHSFAFLVILSGCVKESLDPCPPEPEETIQLLYLRVTDEVSRTDISQSEELDDIMVYLFDRDENLCDTIPYTSAMIRNNVPIVLTDRQLEGGFVTVWANLGNSVEIEPVFFGEDIDDMEVNMLANDSRSDFFLCPGDMFFGYKQIFFTAVDENIEADTLWLHRKNARLNITVRGLQGSHVGTDYYYRIHSIYSAYTFTGRPLLEPRNIWEEGAFNSDDDYVSPEPYIMIHNAVDHIYSSDSRVTVDLYKVDQTRADNLVISGERDVNGDYIKLEQGRTTNVLMVLDPTTGEVELHTEITPWDVIYQWTTW